jgi:two-component system sensor histidine kinase RegB
MIETSHVDLNAGILRLRLDTLIRLRWLAVAGQSLAIVGVHFGLGYALPFGACALIVSLSAWLNIALRLRWPVSHRVPSRLAFGLLAFDILQLAALLYLTGGLQNPFAILFLAPVLISAAALPPRATLGLGALAVACATLLLFAHRPLPWSEPMELPRLYVVGVWLSILLGLAFTGVYAWRVSEEARELAQALAATELVLAREQHLTQLDGLAAAAAHELGTPLATIALVSKELARALPAEGPHREDVQLLRAEVERCRTILGKLTSLEDQTAGPLEQTSLSLLLEEVTSPHRAFDVGLRVRAGGKGPEPMLRRNPGVIYGLGNLIENAVDFAGGSVTIDAAWDDREIRIRIRDDGPGFAPDVLARFGEPYVSTRRRRERARDAEAGGLGLGLFIAKTLLERSGASVQATNAAPGGAVVSVRWTRADFTKRLGAPDRPIAQPRLIQNGADA